MGTSAQNVIVEFKACSTTSAARRSDPAVQGISPLRGLWLEQLAGCGLVVVSGLARGIDGEAHRGALEASGATVAVLGCGIDRDYPRAHADLARRIVEHGAVVSEYGPGIEPAPWRFPARNRIIAEIGRAHV